MDYPSQSMLQRHRWSKGAIIIITCLILLDLALVGLLGYKLWHRQSVSAAEKQDAVALKASALEWQKQNNNFWPEPCIVDPGTARLCAKGEDRDTIVASAQGLDNTYTIFIIDGEFVEGDITKNSLVAYGLSKNALILVNKSYCFTGREVSSGGEFSVIYARTTQTGTEAACV